MNAEDVRSMPCSASARRGLVRRAWTKIHEAGANGWYGYGLKPREKKGRRYWRAKYWLRCAGKQIANLKRRGLAPELTQNAKISGETPRQ